MSWTREQITLTFVQGAQFTSQVKNVKRSANNMAPGKHLHINAAAAYDVFWYLMAPTATHSHTSNNLSQQIPNRFQKKSQVKSLCLKITEKVSFNMSGQNLTKNAKKYFENQKLTPKYFKFDILSYFPTMCRMEKSSFYILSINLIL